MKQGGSSFINALVDFFNLCKLYESYPDQWFQGFIKPIHKEGSKEMLSNYRGITVTSNIYKVFVSLMECQFMKFFEKEGILGELHGAYRKHRRLEDQVFVLKGICSLRKNKKLKTWLSFLDISKAFDTVNRNKLFMLLWQKGIQGKAWRMTRNIYEKVESKVIFGHFESPWFEVFNGVKQGCILSPTLFSIVMLDLIDMFREKDLGVPHSNSHIPCLLYADDIVLMAESENQLLVMLNIAHVFVEKWNMKFNCAKSKVMVIGKRVDCNKKWMLGNLEISECKTYKYLGVIISNSLSDSAHVKNAVKPKGSRLRGYLSSILSYHENISRVIFGNSIWKNIVLPSLTHGGAIWLCNTKESEATLKSIQYSMAKAILQVRSSPVAAATIADLGWLPINMILERMRIKYFHRMKFDLPNTRLCKQIFDALLEVDSGSQQQSKAWPYTDEVKKVFNNVAMDRAFYSENPEWLRYFFKISLDAYKISFFNEIDDRKSLRWYQKFKRSTFGERYLFNCHDFAGARLKFQARTGCLGLGEDKERWGLSNGLCVLCNQNKEDLNHFLLLCPALNEIRTNFYNKLEKECNRLKCEHVWQRFSAASACTKLCWSLGEHTYDFGKDVGHIFDSAVKNYLVEAWHYRRQSIVDSPG